MLAGQDAEALAVSLLHADLLYVGLNCATGPELMTDHLRTLSETRAHARRLRAQRRAARRGGALPRGPGAVPPGVRRASSTPAGSTWSAAVAAPPATTSRRSPSWSADGRRAAPMPQHQRSLVSGIEAVELDRDNRPLLVGERTNVLGSRQFKELVAAGDYEDAAEIGRAQVRGGAPDARRLPAGPRPRRDRRRRGLPRAASCAWSRRR